jgi:hypothetical protein
MKMTSPASAGLFDSLIRAPQTIQLNMRLNIAKLL